MDKAKYNEYMRLYYHRNKEKAKALMKQYYTTHVQEYVSRAKKWREGNKEKYLQCKKKWYNNNKEKHGLWRKENWERLKPIYCFYAQKRRTLAGNLSMLKIKKVYDKNIKKYGVLTCELCKKESVITNSSIDHKKPISKGGTHHLNNLQIAHRICNAKKTNSYPYKFI